MLSHKSSKSHEILHPGNTKSNTNYSLLTTAIFLNQLLASAASLGLMVPRVFMLPSAHGYCHCMYRWWGFALNQLIMAKNHLCRGLVQILHVSSSGLRPVWALCRPSWFLSTATLIRVWGLGHKHSPQEVPVASLLLYLAGSVILKDLTSFVHSPSPMQWRVVLYYRREFLF